MEVITIFRNYRNRRRNRNRALVNNHIRAKRVRLIDNDGSQIGIRNFKSALNKAKMANLDLVLVAPKAKPPVARIMNYDKFRYQQEKNAKKAKKNRNTAKTKQIRLSPMIGIHDFNTKQKQIKRFLHKGSKVQVSIWFKGRSVTHPEVGKKVLLKMANGLKKYAKLTQKPKLDGRNMFLMLSPDKDTNK